MFPLLIQSFKFKIVLGSILALLLGAVSALSFTLIGPCLQVALPSESVAAVNVLSQQPWIQTFIAFFGMSEPQLQEHIGFLLPCLLALGIFLRAILLQVHWYLWEDVGEQFGRNLRGNMVRSLLLSSDRDSSSIEGVESLAGVVANDIRLVRDYVVRMYGGIPREGAQVAFYIVSLILLSPRLFALFFLVVCPSLIILARLGKRLKVRSGKALVSFSQLGEWLQQRILGLETIKHYQSEHQELGSFRQHNDFLRNSLLRAARVRSRSAPISEFFAIAGLAAVCWISLDSIDSESNGGVVMSFFATLAILAQSAGKMARYFNASREGAASWTRVQAFSLGKESAIKASEAKEKGQNSSIELNNVSFSNLNGLILDDINLRFESGGIYTICGHSGAGKTTVVRAILGSLVVSGEIRFNGVLSKENLVYIPQNIELGGGRVLENLAFPSSEINEVLGLKSLDKFGLKLEDLPNAEELSGGQKQRLMLARTAYHSPQWIVLDEGTSALDPSLENLVLDYLAERAKLGALVICVSHRHSVLKRSRSIIMMKKGKVAVEGDLAKLEKADVFRQFWKSGANSPT